MANKFDKRRHPDVQALLKKLPPLQYTPLVEVPDLHEVVKVFAVLPALEYPIGSAGELIEKLGGPDKTFEVVGVTVDPLRMIKYMPAHYFPIASVENFIEKMAELVRNNRKQTDVPTELESLKKQLPKLSYPISDAKALLKMVGPKKAYKFQGIAILPEQMVHYIPSHFFPIRSEEDFDKKVAQLMLTRPLIVED